MTINRKTTVRYSLSFKLQVIKELESGEGIEALRRRYGIKGGQTIQKWIGKFGKSHLLNQIVRVETLDERDRIKELEEELKKTKLALADSLLAQRSLEVVIAEANKEYKTDLKKNFGDSASTNFEKSSK